MVTKRSSIICLTATLTLLVVIGGWALLDGRPVQAAPDVLYVAPGGDCGGASPCYSTVQAAVDAAQAGDEIRIAAGTYSGVNNQGGKPQVVYIAKSLILRGGYTTSNWNTPDPESNITEINAQTLGRVAYITGTNTIVAFEGLRFTYGDANGLGGHSPFYENYDAGGNLYIDKATVTLNDCHVTDGAAPSSGYGGGVYIRNGALTATRTLWHTDEAGHGGAAYLYHATTRITESVFQNNRTTAVNGEGPALAVVGGTFAFSGSTIEANTAAQKAPFSGALEIHGSQFLIESSVIRGTVFSSGVRLALNSNGILRGSTIQANQYGGVRILDGNITMIDNEVLYNGTDGYYVEAGVYVSGVRDTTVYLVRNHIHHNRHAYAMSQGGGVYVAPAAEGWVTLSDNLIEENTAGKSGGPDVGFGGGVYINGNRVTLERNLIRNNTAIGSLDPAGNQQGGRGGGVYIRGNSIVRNNIITGNRARFRGSGVYVVGSAPELYHNTIAQNAWGGSDDATGVYVAEASSTERAQPTLWNTIIVSQTVGIYAKGDVVKNIVNADGILWYGNTADTGGTGTFFLSNEHTGDPLFVNPTGGDYHISPGSAAIDNGVVTSVTNDIDGEPRFGIPDLGADEYWVSGALQRVYLPLVTRQQ
jgi:hypothetical protein